MHKRKALKVIIAGGGTGGHLYPGIALAQEFQKRYDSEIMFVGTAYGLENKVLPKMSFRFKKIWMRGLQRNLSLGNLLFPLRLVVSLIQCTSLILAFKPDIILGTGGYVSGPVLMMGITLRIPTVIQEQNSYPGLVNRLLGKRVDQVHVTFEDSLSYFKRNGNIFVSGNPVRRDLNQVSKQAALTKFNLQPDKTTLFVFGGSQGARALNHAVLNSIEQLMSFPDLQIIWATGPYDAKAVASKCNGENRIAHFEFIEDMASAYAAADFVLCRSGATTLAEIAICGLPAILVPYPYSAAGHQKFNAKATEAAGAAIAISEENLGGKTLLAAISELKDNSQKREAMARAAKKLAKPDAAAEIVSAIRPLLSKLG
ncbi:MAG: undecaprenyldiphospho-muramoylpentapeptide beta-N-acetylglucosaminyltransferase [bacterium]